jgi:NCS1 family nucleobase:cation symporter-1
MNRRFMEIDESKDEPRFGSISHSPSLEHDMDSEGKNMADFEGKEKLASQVHVLPA